MTNIKKAFSLSILSVFIIGAFLISASSAYAAIGTIHVTSPDGAENWSDTHNITWTTDGGAADTVEIYYCSNADCSTQGYIGTSTADALTYSWNTGSLNGTSYKIRIVDEALPHTAQDVSDAVFTIDNTDPGDFSTTFQGGASYINNLASTSVYFSLNSDAANVGLIYNYVIDDTDGGTPAIAASGTIPEAIFTVSGIDVSSLDDDTLTLSVSIRDRADPGNQTATGTATITKDTVAPTTPDIDMVATDDVINAAERTATVTVTGVNESGSTVTLNGSTTEVLTATTWSHNLDADAINAFGQGAETLTAVATDAAGNHSTSTRDISVDTEAPTITVSDIRISDDTGLSSSDFVTKTTSQTITATTSAELAVGDILWGSVNGGSAYANITAKISGTAITWNAADLSVGSNSIVFKVTDSVGNPDVMATTQNYVLDLAAPGASKPIDDAQRLKAGAVSTSNVQSTEAGNIYLVKNGTSATTLAEINSAIAANNAFLGRGSAEAATPYTITVATGLNDGVYDIVSVDAAGNVSDVVAGWLTVDNIAPTISSVSIPNVAMNINDEVTATITVGDDTGAGAPYVLTFGTIAGFTLGSLARPDNTTYTATFTITDSGLDIASSSDVLVSNLVLTDTAGNPSNAFSGAVSPAGDADTIDAHSPTAVSISVGAGSGLGGVIKNGDAPTVTVVLSEPVSSFDKNDVTVANGTLGVLTSADSITFTGTFTPSTIEAATNLATVGIVYTDSAGNDASGTGATSSNYVIDTVLPTVTNVTASTASGSYKAGDTIAVTATFSEAVNATGFPRIELAASTTARYADYISGTGSDTLTFNYIVQPGDTASDLDYVAVGSLTLNDGTIKDLVGNDATLTLVAPGEAGSLGANKAFIIDTTAPTVALTYSVSTPLKRFDYVTITATFTDTNTIDETPVPQIAIVTQDNTGDLSATNMVKTSNTVWTYEWYVPANTKDGVATVSIIATDLAGNNNATATNNTKTINDTAAPIVSALTVGSLSSTTATLTATTDEVAMCRYSNTEKDYSAMTPMTVSTTTTPHTQALTGLTASTGYTYYVRCADASNNIMGYSAHVSFTTAASGIDVTAPVLTSIVVSSIASTSAVVTWTSDDNASSSVEYSTDYAYGTASSSDTLDTSHSIVLSGLTPSTQYHYRVKSTNAVNLTGTSEDHVFTTAAGTQADGTLGVTGVTASSSYATIGGGFTSGWSWIFNVTVPTSEASTTMKFSDWVGVGTSTIPALNNIRFYSLQSSNASTTASSILISGSNTYADYMTIDGDLDLNTAGRQIQIIVETQIPSGSASGAYSTSYGVKSI